MSSIVQRLVKGSELTFQEMDDNFDNLNTDKIEKTVENTFTAPQRTSISLEDNVIDFTTNNNFTLTATSAVMGTPTVTGCTGQSGVIVISSAENITGWDALYIFKTVPTSLSGDETFAYFIESETSIRIGVLK